MMVAPDIAAGSPDLNGPTMAAMVSESTIKRLKVHALPDGTLLPNYRAGARQPTDDDWWQDVLHDPRAYVPVNETRFDEHSPYAHYRLDQQPHDTVAFSCLCGLGAVIDKATLIQQVGGDANVLWVARHVMDCGKRNKVTNNCRAYCQR